MPPKPYKLVRSKRRTIALAITPDATLVVRAPMRIPILYIEHLIHKKADWIERAIARVKSRPQPIAHQYMDGEKFLYLGKSYALRVRGDTDRLVFNDCFILSAKTKPRAHTLFASWYRAEAKRLITEHVAHYARANGLKPRSIKITSARKRWGSCSPEGNLSFSLRLVMAPITSIDYVVVHELAHLKHRNHSKVFWASVKTMYPDYKPAKAWLRQNEGAANLL